MLANFRIPNTTGLLLQFLHLYHTHFLIILAHNKSSILFFANPFLTTIELRYISAKPAFKHSS